MWRGTGFARNVRGFRGVSVGWEVTGKRLEARVSNRESTFEWVAYVCLDIVD